MADNQDALAGIMQTHRIENGSEAKNNVAPTFTSGRPKVELTHHLSCRRQFGMTLPDSEAGQTIEYPEFSFPQPLVSKHICLVARVQCRTNGLCCASGSKVWRTQYDLRPI